MRVTTTIAVLCLVAALLVASCEGSWNKGARKHDQLVKAFRKHTRLSSPLKKVHQHGFRGLQMPAAPACNATGFEAKWNVSMTACEAQQWPDFDKMDPNNQTDVAYLKNWCSGNNSCGTHLKAIFQNTEYMKCLADFSPEYAFAPMGAAAMCISPASNPEANCQKVVVSLGDGDKCEGKDGNPYPYNATLCRQTGAKHTCTWDRYERRCQANATSVVTNNCKPVVRECITAMVDFYTHPSLQVFGSVDMEMPDMSMTSKYLDMMCLKDPKGQACYPVLDKMFNGGDGDDSMKYICNDNNKFQCLKLVGPILKDVTVLGAKQNFYQCVKMCKNQTVCVEDYRCPEQYAYSVMEANNFGSDLQKMCARNAAGKWCMTVMEEHSDIGERCADPVMRNYTLGNGTCSPKCNDELKVALDDIGCCMGQNMESRGELDLSVVPAYVKNNSMTRGPTPSPYPQQGEGKDDDDFDVKSLGLCSKIGQAGVDKINTEKCPTVDAITTVDPCYTNEWDMILEELATNCDESSTSVFEKTFQSDAAFSTAVDGFCKGTCKASVDKVLGPKWRRCLPKNSADELKSTLVFCEKDKPEGVYCAVAARSYEEGNCDKYDNSQSMCGSAAQCAWVGGNDGCEINPTADYLSKVCNPCLTKIANALDGQAAAEASFYQQYICAKADNKFCFPLVASEIAKIDGFGFKETTLNTVCSNRTKEKCMIKMMNGAASMVSRQISTAYRQCAQYANTQTYMNQCVSSTANYFREVSRMQTQINSMCRKNANEVFCMSLLNKAMQNPCLQPVISQQGCTAACNTNLTAMIADFGCCVGNVHQMVKNVHVKKDAFPEVKNNYGLKPQFPAAPAKANVTEPATIPDNAQFNGAIGEPASDNGMFVFTQCADLKDTIAAKMALVCKRPKGTKKIAKKKKLPISYKKLKDDPVLEKRLIDGMVGDTATALGIPTEDLVNPHFEEDTTSQVVTQKRRFGALATSSGTIFAYEIQSTSDEATDEIAAKLEELEASQELVYPTATDVVKDCGCKDETVTSLAVEAPPIVTAAPDPAAPVTPAPTSGNTTSASAVSAVVAIVAVIAALLF